MLPCYVCVCLKIANLRRLANMQTSKKSHETQLGLSFLMCAILRCASCPVVADGDGIVVHRPPARQLTIKAGKVAQSTKANIVERKQKDPRHGRPGPVVSL